MTSFLDALAAFKPREKRVDLVADGPLLAEYEGLNAQLADAINRERTSLADGSVPHELAERVAALEPQIRAATVTFVVRAIGRNAHSRLDAEHRTGDDGRLNMATFMPALVAACSVDPAMTVEDVTKLSDVLSQGQFLALFQAAFDACIEVDGVPFSELASRVIQP